MKRKPLATGRDIIPIKLSKMATSVVAPSLTTIFIKSILAGIYPTECKPVVIIISF